jgi:hypothetical protein
MIPPILIPKNTRESYRIAWEEFEGHSFVDLRLYYRASDGEMKPSRKGVAIKPELLAEVCAALGMIGGAS